MNDYAETVEMVRLRCYCSVPFSIPQALFDAHKRIGTEINCPLGHQPCWGETEHTRTRRERDQLKQDAARLEQERAAAEAARATAERALARHKKRAAAGTCPCCKRTFGNMAAHLRQKHPEFVAENVVRLKA